ncbi:MAG: hypothetical protein C6P37_12760 [Caldibacillus debilis]|uniref:Uncharacterized protein n=1 Tax=Caldibacillus debilis TaxID=301148 RepID=A0A3E0K252_9BACI|nr:MAG: hypothetical protein C6P37_12760 [Caldibacillus debilis]REJ30580.1 MAG: hypothetical protein C6W56_02870 [Caldibacillus debilis]
MKATGSLPPSPPLTRPFRPAGLPLCAPGPRFFSDARPHDRKDPFPRTWPSGAAARAGTGFSFFDPFAGRRPSGPF